MAKKIAHIFNSSIVSGPETLVLPALRARMFEDATVIFLNETRKGELGERPIAYARSLGLPTQVVSVRSRLDLSAIRELARCLREIRPEVAHSHDVKASTYLLAASKLVSRPRFKLVSTHHGVRGRSGFRSKLYEGFYAKHILPRFDGVLAVCTSDRDLLVRRGLDPRRTLLHLNGVDRARVSPDVRDRERARIRQQWNLAEAGVPSDAVILGMAGRLAGEKRFDRALQVCAELKKLSPNQPWRLVIFGSGPLEAELKALTQKLDLEKSVCWMGYRSGLGDEMAGFDVLLSMSDAEGLPINLIEAGWAGTPVFATRVDGNLDLIPSPDLGFLFPVEETSENVARRLASVLEETDLRQKVGWEFQKRVISDFSGKKWIERLTQCYQAIDSIACS